MPIPSRRAFEFNDNSVASAYDAVWVPVLFRPWATRLLEEHPQWKGQRVLDIATGTGGFARRHDKKEEIRGRAGRRR